MLGLRRGLPDEVACHSFVQKADLSNLPLFRKFILEACGLMKVDAKVSEALQLAIDEICSNLIIHGYKDMEAGEISLSVRQEQKEIEILVEDSGKPFDPAKLEAPELSDKIDERKIGGLGVFMVKEMVDEMSYESTNGRNRLSLKMKIEIDNKQKEKTDGN